MGEPLADVGRGGVFECGGCGEAVSGVEVEAMAEARDAFEFDAAGADLSLWRLLKAASLTMTLVSVRSKMEAVMKLVQVRGWNFTPPSYCRPSDGLAWV